MSQVVYKGPEGVGCDSNPWLKNGARIFYGRVKFCCKAAQLCATRRECLRTKTPSVGNAVQSNEMLHNSLGLN